MSATNTEWVKNLKNQIDTVPDCASLDKKIQELKDMFVKQIEEAGTEVSKLAALIVPPTSLPKVIKYLKNLATQYLAPYNQAVAKRLELIKAYAEVLKAIEEKRNSLHCSLKPADQYNSFKIDLANLATQKLYSSNPTLASLTDLTQKFNGRVPTLQVIAGQLGVSVTSLPTVAAQYGGSIPFVQSLLDKHQYVEIPVAPAIPSVTTPTDIPLDHPAPTIDSIDPTLGDKNGGITVTITGTGFLDGCTVKFGDADATEVVFTSSTEIQCSTPSGPTGLIVGVTVTNPDLQSVTLPTSYTFVEV